MQTQYMTVTLQLSGYDEDALHDMHAQLRDILQAWRPLMNYAELTIAYQDQDQIDEDAQVEAEPWSE